MHVPTLENVYQTLHKQHAILLKEREKISKIKTKLGISEIDTPKSRLIGINKTEYVYHKSARLSKPYISMVTQFRKHFEFDFLGKSIRSSIQC